MAKTRSGGKGERADAEDRNDGLEIISIGSLYKGAWEKKYWTTSRGKDRYPYPVGYQAVRAYNGTTYKMEICEGVNGPRFLISSDDGSLSTGKTPDQAWEEFQKKGCPRIKIWQGKRLSSKMDGLELFGFKNQFIQRLLWELVRDINGIAERSFVSSNASDMFTRTEPDDCCPNAGPYPDLLLCLGKPHVTRKTIRCEHKNKKLNVQARPQSPDFTCIRPSNVKNDHSLGQGSSTTHYGSEVHEDQNQIGVPAPLLRISSICKSSNYISSKNEQLLNPIEISDDKKVGAVPSKGLTGFLNSENCKTTELTENLSTEEPFHRLHDAELKISNLLGTSEDKKLLQSCSKEPVGCIDIDLCAPDTLDFVQGASNAFSGAKTKSCQLESMETLAEKTQDEAMGKTGNAAMMIMSSKLQNFVYSKKRHESAISFQENAPVMECTEYDKFKLGTPEMYTAKDILPSSEIIQINNSNDKPCEPDDTVGLSEETPQTHSDVLDSNLVEPNETSSQNPTLLADESKCFGTKEAPFISEPVPLQNQELQNNLGRSVTFVGRYLHPMAVSSLFLSTRKDEIHVCVLCGQLTGQYRTLFSYKVAITEKCLGCPSAMGHSSILLPDPKHNFIKDTMAERFGVQLTPNGQCIVLIGSIKTPNCREGKIDCYCSSCTSVCAEKNALKIVQVKHGYVSVVTTLETIDNAHCVLVCEPNQLVSVGESGRLQVWVMNSTWSEKVEHFIIPADGSVSPGIVELKRVPKCTHLVVGHNSGGKFSLWDIAKRNCVTSFSALKSPINEFFPISLFRWQTKGSGFSYASEEEQSDKLLEVTNSWYLEQRETCWFSSSEEDVAMWFFVSTISDLDCCHNHVSTSRSSDMHTARNWRLALLMKNSITFGSPLDLRTTGIGVSCGYGIISTSDGVVYMWELSKGSKIGTLHHFQDGNVTVVATDDSRGAFGVAGGGGQLFLYLHHPELDSN